VGFAHLRPRWAATRRVGAVYRQHDESFSRGLTRTDRAAATTQLQRLRRRWTP
jgi:hypothetical protein